MEITVESLETQALTKAQLAELLFERIGLNKREAKDMVETFFEEIRDALERGEGFVTLASGRAGDEDSLQIRTQYMQVFMDKGVARTDRAVNIVNGPSTLAGTGMEYERESGHLTLLSAVKGKFNAPKH